MIRPSLLLLLLFFSLPVFGKGFPAGKEKTATAAVTSDTSGLAGYDRKPDGLPVSQLIISKKEVRLVLSKKIYRRRFVLLVGHDEQGYELEIQVKKEKPRRKK